MVVGGTVLAATVVAPATVVAAPAAAVVHAPAAAVVAEPASVVAVVADDSALGVLAAVLSDLSSEPHAPSSPTAITTGTNDANIRRRPVEVHPFTSFIVRTYRAMARR